MKKKQTTPPPQEQLTKLCRHCKSEIPKAAKVCPNCQKKQKGKGGLIVLVIIIIIIILLIAIGSSGSNDSGTKIDNSNASSSGSSDADADSVSEDSNDSDGSIESAGDSSGSDDSEVEESVVLVGGSFETDGIKVTVNDATIDYQVENDTYGFYELDDGLMYIAVSFTFENIGDSDEYVSIYDFDCYADNTLCDQKYVGGDDFVNTNLSSGRNVSFTTYYAVPEDAESVELEYTENVWTDKKIFIQILP